MPAAASGQQALTAQRACTAAGVPSSLFKLFRNVHTSTPDQSTAGDAVRCGKWGKAWAGWGGSQHKMRAISEPTGRDTYQHVLEQDTMGT